MEIEINSVFKKKGFCIYEIKVIFKIHYDKHNKMNYFALDKILFVKLLMTQ
jgi:hypothetical protein